MDAIYFTSAEFRTAGEVAARRAQEGAAPYEHALCDALLELGTQGPRPPGRMEPHLEVTAQDGTAVRLAVLSSSVPPIPDARWVAVLDRPPAAVVLNPATDGV